MFRTHVLIITAGFEALATTGSAFQNDPYNDALRAIQSILASMIWYIRV